MKKIAILLSLLLLASCGKKEEETSSSETPNTPEISVESKEDVKPPFEDSVFEELTEDELSNLNLENINEDEYQLSTPENWDLVAIMYTNKGVIKLKLFKDEAKFAVTNFVSKAQSGYYEWIIFHRVIKDFMIQGWDPTWTWRWWESSFGFSFRDEFDEKLTHKPYSLSMANSGLATNWSQFFIVHGLPQDHLNGKHTVFWQVLEGSGIVDKIANVSVESYSNKPHSDVIINKVYIKEYKDWILVPTTFDWEEEVSKIKNNLQVQKWAVVELHMDMSYEKDWKEIKESTRDSNSSITFVIGQDKLLSKIEYRLFWAKVWDKFDFDLDKAYWDYDLSKVLEIPKTQVWPSFDQFKVWDVLEMWHERIAVKVIDKNADTLKVDSNHPLAGLDIKFTDVEILKIR